MANQILDSGFIDSLPDEPLRAATAVADQFRSWRNIWQGFNDRSVYLQAIEAYAQAEALAASLQWEFSDYKVSGDRESDLRNIEAAFRRLGEWAEKQTDKILAADMYRDASLKYAEDGRNPFEYQFDAGQLSRLQVLVNEVRDQISSLQGIPDAWRRRMLRRLEALQSELHERMSSMDRFWGVIGEALPVLHALGVASKPIVNRLREIAEIGLQIHAKAFAIELPPGTAILPPGEDDPPLPEIHTLGPDEQRLAARN